MSFYKFLFLFTKAKPIPVVSSRPHYLPLKFLIRCIVIKTCNKTSFFTNSYSMSEGNSVSKQPSKGPRNGGIAGSKCMTFTTEQPGEGYMPKCMFSSDVVQFFFFFFFSFFVVVLLSFGKMCYPCFTFKHVSLSWRCK